MNAQDLIDLVEKTASYTAARTNDIAEGLAPKLGMDKYQLAISLAMGASVATSYMAKMLREYFEIPYADYSVLLDGLLEKSHLGGPDE